VSLVVKDTEVVTLSLGQTQRVHIDFGRLSSVHTSQIDDQLSVDIHPDVIVSSETELLSSVVLEDRHKHHSEVEILVPFATVRIDVVSETLVVDVEKVLEVSTVDSVTARGQSSVTSGVDLSEGDIFGDKLTVAGSGSVSP